jgi:hypothetical protein
MDYEDPKYLRKIMLQFYVNNLENKWEVLKWYVDLNSGGTVHSKEEINRVKQMLDDEFNPPVPEKEYGVHRSHCCAEHGCKYNNRKCPVVTGLIAQTSFCYDCEDI